MFDNKDKRRLNHKQIILVIAIFAVILIAALYLAIQYERQKELEKIYSAFRCNCCDGTILASDEICAIGLREKIRQLQNSGLGGHELSSEAVKLLGVNNIIDSSLRERTYAELVKNPPSRRAVLNLSEDYVNFGNVSESKMSFVMKDFIVKNSGNEDLYIDQVATSCSCLTSKFVTNNKESPTYGRFSFLYGMTVRIAPGEEMRLRVTYDARVNSFFRGQETRFVYIRSNDPIMPVKQITVDINHVD